MRSFGPYFIEITRTSSKTTRMTSVREVQFYPINKESFERKTTINILSLNDDCFEKICVYLNDSELLSLIRTNTRLKLPCEQAFRRKYCRKILTVSNFNGTRLDFKQLKHSINILKHFGHLTSRLCIRFKLEKIESLLEAVTMNCSKNLFDLELNHLGNRVIRSSVSYKMGLEVIRSFLSNLSTHFPKLYHLELIYCNTSTKCPYSDAVIQPIATLKSFATTEDSAGQIFTLRHLKDFLSLNRQLENLSVRMEVNELDDTDRSWFISQRFIQYLDQTLPFLTCLEINRVSTLGIPEMSLHPIGFKNLKQLTFRCFLEFQNVDRGFMSFLSESVEILKLSTFDFNIENFVKNVTQFKQLKTLDLEYPLELASRLLNANQKVSAVWSPIGIRQLILSNNRLNEIIIRQHPSEVDEEWNDGSDCFNTKYRDIIKENINGHQWKMYGNSKCFSFRKMM